MPSSITSKFTKNIKSASQSVRFPPQMICKICKEIMNQAAIATCCGYSSCEVCLKQKVIELEKCPLCNNSINLLKILPNKKLQQIILWFEKLKEEGKLQVVQIEGKQCEQSELEKISLNESDIQSSSSSLSEEDLEQIMRAIRQQVVVDEKPRDVEKQADKPKEAEEEEKEEERKQRKERKFDKSKPQIQSKRQDSRSYRSSRHYRSERSKQKQRPPKKHSRRENSRRDEQEQEDDRKYRYKSSSHHQSRYRSEKDRRDKDRKKYSSRYEDRGQSYQDRKKKRSGYYGDEKRHNYKK